MLARRNLKLTGHSGRVRRRGATAVESALVLSIFLMLLFGMFEYCRFLLVLHVANNAARDGARYAAVNVDKPSTFGTTNYTDGSGKLYLSVQNYVTARMGNLTKDIEGFRIAVFSVDNTGIGLTPPVIRPKTTSTGSPIVYPNPFNSSDPHAVAWNASPFPDRIAVYINGTYRPKLPTFLLMPSTIAINVYAVSGGEG